VAKEQPVQAKDPVQDLELGAQGKLKENQRCSQQPKDLPGGHE
jgi:hypothetical protein